MSLILFFKLDQQNFVSTMLIYLKKAFDTVDKILLKTLLVQVLLIKELNKALAYDTRSDLFHKYAFGV